MDADAPVLEALLITFTVVTVGFVFIIVGTFTVRRFISPLKLSVLAAFWAWGFIAVKRLHFWGLRSNGRDQMFSLMEIHAYEISSSVMLLLLMLFHTRPSDLEALSRSVDSVKLFQVGLSITGNGMGLIFAGGRPVMSVFFPGDLGVFFVAIGLSVVIGGYRLPYKAGPGHMAGRPLVVYILVLLTATYLYHSRLGEVI
jgi:hypothetical protein